MAEQNVGSRRGRSVRGFSLLELASVIAVVAILSASIAPTVRERLRQTQSEDAADALVERLNALRNYARTRGYCVEVSLVDESTISVEVHERCLPGASSVTTLPDIELDPRVLQIDLDPSFLWSFAYDVDGSVYNPSGVIEIRLVDASDAFLGEVRLSNATGTARLLRAG